MSTASACVRVCVYDWCYLWKYTVRLMTPDNIPLHWQQEFIMNFSN